METEQDEIILNLLEIAFLYTHGKEIDDDISKGNIRKMQGRAVVYEEGFDENVQARLQNIDISTLLKEQFWSFEEAQAIYEQYREEQTPLGGQPGDEMGWLELSLYGTLPFRTPEAGQIYDIRPHRGKKPFQFPERGKLIQDLAAALKAYNDNILKQLNAPSVVEKYISDVQDDLKIMEGMYEKIRKRRDKPEGIKGKHKKTVKAAFREVSDVIEEIGHSSMQAALKAYLNPHDRLTTGMFNAFSQVAPKKYGVLARWHAIASILLALGIEERTNPTVRSIR